MKIIVGLGNPDAKYKNTFHNLGFMAVDMIAESLGMEFKKEKCRALIAEGKVNGEKVILAKPLTYMNLSGESVRELVSFFKAKNTELLVFCDDVDINKGEIRIRTSGSGGTHNGLKNIVLNLNSTDFYRVRIGFKSQDNGNIPLIDLVLSGIKEEDKPVFADSLKRASQAGVDFANGVSIDRIMQKYNGKN